MERANNEQCNRKRFLTKSEKINRATIICQVYSEGLYNLESICKSVAVPYHSFKNWAQPELSPEDIQNGRYRRGFVHEVHEMYKVAMINSSFNYRQIVKHKVRDNLLRRISSEYVDTRTLILVAQAFGDVFDPVH